MELYLGIYDDDPVYSRRLLSGIMKRMDLKCQTVEFTKPENIELFAQRHILELVLVSYSAFKADMKSRNTGRFIALCEDIPTDEEQAKATELGIGLLYKYQPLSVLIREIQSSTDKLVSSISGKQLIAVYSPINRCGKSLFALAVAQLIGENRPTLLINLENFSQLRAYTDGSISSDLSDAIYYYLQDELAGMERKLIKSLGGVDYILPAASANDLRGLRAEEVLGMVNEFISKSIYSCIVVDVGSLQDVYGLLPGFDSVFMPVIQGEAERMRILEFYDEISRTGTGLLERIQEVSPPKVSWEETVTGEGIEFPTDYRVYIRTCINKKKIEGHDE